ncbi:MAG TPA: sigma-70 family RNA polymerase sigma factor [Firmicutes bacterium]|nr:sigma-70 family RNA polymerase sigma factor [Bacillota bacterium]
MQDISAIIREIQQGNERLREEFLMSQKEFIRGYASYVCKTRLDWHNDDELSVALIAFNKAVDTYEPAAGKRFTGYAKTLIRNSLVDYFRSRQKSDPTTLSTLDGIEDSLNRLQMAASLNSYLLELDQQERAYEIECLKELLSRFGLTLPALVKNSPRHRDTRDSLKDIALKTAGESMLVERIYREKRLPLKEIQLLTGAKRKLLEKWRRYLLSLVLIASSEEMEGLAEYIWGKGALRAK